MGSEQYKNTTGHEKGGDISISKKKKTLGANQLEIQSRNIVEELLIERKKDLSGNPLLLIIIITKILNRVKVLLGQGLSPEEIKKSEKIKFE